VASVRTSAPHGPRSTAWASEYCAWAQSDPDDLVVVDPGNGFSYLFDLAGTLRGESYYRAPRVVGVWGLSRPMIRGRDHSRMHGHPRPGRPLRHRRPRCRDRRDRRCAEARRLLCLLDRAPVLRRRPGHLGFLASVRQLLRRGALDGSGRPFRSSPGRGRQPPDALNLPGHFAPPRPVAGRARRAAPAARLGSGPCCRPSAGLPLRPVHQASLRPVSRPRAGHPRLDRTDRRGGRRPLRLGGGCSRQRFPEGRRCVAVSTPAPRARP
jgi:hypothetical protein